ncbi:uncharacterized protein [Prorops nasuta]|uniref:uncharacterized protein n=1 Tax=Prorops nasuta TaxID=863751 RepID=UPI0034CE6E0F
MSKNVHNIRGRVGKKKGKFISDKCARKMEMFLSSTEGKHGRRIKPSQIKINENNEDKENHCEGRRIIDVNKVAEDLWCNNCNSAISLRDIQVEKQYSIASKWLVKCQSCLNMVQVETSRNAKNFYFDSNLKLAIGMLDAGIGEIKINTLLSALNVQSVTDKSLKRYERCVGPVIEEVANNSCVDAIEAEKYLTFQHQKEKLYSIFNYTSTSNYPEEQCDIDINNNNDPINLVASYDAAWTKRGRQHNSLRGHGSLMGYYSKKVLAYATRNICCKNANKNMVQNIIGDDHSSSIAALRRLSPYVIQKWSDLNHVAKTFNSKLYEMKLSATLRDYCIKVFALAVKQNKGSDIKHNNCGPYCEKDDKNIHIFKYFKDGKCLTDFNLQDKLDKIIKPFINYAPQIAQCASSQSNESFNNTICSKHLKSSFYGDSESHCYRVGIAVCQRNLGYGFILELLIKLGLSPGKHTRKYRIRKYNKYCYEAEKKRNISTKRRRLFLKKDRSSKSFSLANCEGVSYESGCVYLNTSELIDEVIIAANVSYDNCAIVAFDIETTGLQTTDVIVQIAAVSDQNSFNVYIMPTKCMSPHASNVTGIEVINNEMFMHSKKVTASSARDGIISFLYFLKHLRKPCVLVARNGFRFDVPRIINLVTSVELLKELKIFVKGFCHTMPVFKSILLDRKKQKKSFSQNELANDYLNNIDLLVTHVALNDALMLQKLIQKLCNDTTAIVNNTRSINFLISSKERLVKAKECYNSLNNILISKCMKARLSKIGINEEHLRKACNIGGIQALTMLLGESVNGKPRVTNNKKVILAIFDHFCK